MMLKMKLGQMVAACLISILFALPVMGWRQPLSTSQAEGTDGDSTRAILGQDLRSAENDSQEGNSKPAQSGVERDESGNQSSPRSDIPPNIQANRRGQISEEEAAVIPYYNNFLVTYRLGPEDVISVTVFGQERYSKSGIVIPPHGRISYPLIPEGILVAGKTTEELQDELTKKLDEFIIDPKITVTLDRAMSARYAVLGDVGQPGIRVMTRRLSVYEALAEAGGVLNTGDKKKVYILRRQLDGSLRPIPINVKAIERGQARETAYLVPGDQVIVPGNTFKKIQSIMSLLPIVTFARIFTGGGVF